MATRKAFIQKDEDIVLPYTRGELVLDSKGEEAFHSLEFIASRTKPGLFTPHEKEVVKKAIVIPENIPDNKVVLVLKIDENNNIIDIYPITKAKAVEVEVDGRTATLETIITLVLDLDDYPIQNSKKAVTSGGVWLHIDDTVGEIHRTVVKL